MKAAKSPRNGRRKPRCQGLRELNSEDLAGAGSADFPQEVRQLRRARQNTKAVTSISTSKQAGQNPSSQKCNLPLCIYKSDKEKQNCGSFLLLIKDAFIYSNLKKKIPVSNGFHKLINQVIITL